MRKILLFAMFALFAMTTSTMKAQEQEMLLGVNLGLPVGDWSNGYGFGAQADFQYLFSAGEGFQVGPMVALSWYSSKSITVLGHTVKGDDAMFLPLGGTARYWIDQFYLGIDLGYGIGLAPSGNDGGFYFRPKAGYDFGPVNGVVSYSGVSLSGVTASSINLGVEFSL